MSDRRLRILFALAYPGYLRYYDDTLRELAARGHDVTLTFESPHKQPEGLRALERAPEGLEIVDTFPHRSDGYAPVLRPMRRIVDYARFLHPVFNEAQHVRRRMDGHVPRGFGALRRCPPLRPRAFGMLLRGLLALERAVPSAMAVDRFVARRRPDVVVVSPLIMDASRQTELFKSARRLGVPSVLSVGSWDHLTTKGLIRTTPDRILVWNEIQRQEAAHLHGVDPATVELTGAQPFDRWFARRPELDGDAFRARVNLPAGRHFVLFVGSTASISETGAEQHWVRRWIEALRASDDPAVRDLAILVRPHPYNPGGWDEADLSDLGAAAVWPSAGVNIVAEDNRSDFFHSMVHAEAVVGVNTSAMIEAAILGRTVLTVRAGDFAETQGGTVHFRYLLPEHGGPLLVAESFAEHAAQLSGVLAQPGTARARTQAFVSAFVRPNGLDRPCVPQVADAIERVALAGPRSLPPDGRPLLLRAGLWSIGVGRQAWRRDARVKATRKATHRMCKRWRRQRKRWHKRRRRAAARVARARRPGRIASAARTRQHV